MIGNSHGNGSSGARTRSVAQVSAEASLSLFMCAQTPVIRHSIMYGQGWTKCIAFYANLITASTKKYQKLHTKLYFYQEYKY